MIKASIHRLSQILDSVPPLLNALSEEELSLKPSVEKWSKKEILGHLIDSATNNHHRFVRGQFESNPAIAYDQNQWNKFNFYQEMDHKNIIHFWTAYNVHLLEIVKHISPDHFKRKVMIDRELLTLEELFVDYVKHLEHHLNQIIQLPPNP
ncbi:MAG: DinB family protein [Salibacteraceae bacterium]|nr:DinB family protein [Salibacteraceae bacterium]